MLGFSAPLRYNKAVNKPCLFLFDVDYTLLYTGGAGLRAMNLAFQELYGLADGFRGIPFAGRTDIALFRDALARQGLLDGTFPRQLARFRTLYHRHLARTLKETQGQVLPGVQELLAALRGRGAYLGLATGNFRRGALLKLRHYGLEGYFLYSPDGAAGPAGAAPPRPLLAGAFGDDAEERERIVALAARRLARRARRPLQECRLYVVGDTPEDIAAARASGATAVAVATGKHSLQELSQAGADLLFPTLAEGIPTLTALAGR